MKKFNTERIALLAKELPHWRVHAEGQSMVREFVFADFVSAFGFMTQVAMAAEKTSHHPEWFNVYNRVKVVWTTHDVQGLSQRDEDMARLCDTVFTRMQGSGHAG